MTAHLFSPLTLRGVTFRNRIGMSPMCQYSSADGFVNDWHLAHIGARAAGGVGLTMMEATGVTPEGRITPGCAGIWRDAHIEPFRRIVDFVESQGAVAGIQLAHAGRKASMNVPWKGDKRLTAAEGGWQTIAPSPVPFAAEHDAPLEMSAIYIRQAIDAFVAAAERAVKAGFRVIELHGAHGYLLHEFLSPISNKRTDSYGGPLDNRCRLIWEIAEQVRAKIPKGLALGARLSCADWVAGGLTIEDTIHVAAGLKQRGVDFIDCSSGGISPDARPKAGPGYQVPFARDIRAKAGVPTCAVGMITEAVQADALIRDGAADMVFIGRALLRDPSWALHAAAALGQKADVPLQYLRAY